MVKMVPLAQWSERNRFHLYLVLWHLARWPNTCGTMAHIPHSQSPARSLIQLRLSLTVLNFSDRTIPS